MNQMHPARTMPFAELYAGLLEAKAARLINERSCGPLRLYCYTQACVYNRQWTPITLLARGLIIDIEQQRVVATPFPKFFNLSEATASIPSLPFDVFEKLDGSLIIIWHDKSAGWRCATKGSFESDQAKAAAALLATIDKTDWHPGDTYLAEYVAPDNRIVVPYDHAELVLLAIYDYAGWELPG